MSEIYTLITLLIVLSTIGYKYLTDMIRLFYEENPLNNKKNLYKYNSTSVEDFAPDLDFTPRKYQIIKNIATATEALIVFFTLFCVALFFLKNLLGLESSIAVYTNLFGLLIAIICIVNASLIAISILAGWFDRWKQVNS